MYHWEVDQEDFLVLAGEALLVIEGEERPLRGLSTGPDWGAYTVDRAAIRHGAGVERETTEPDAAYARFPDRRPTRCREGWLPDPPPPANAS